MINIIIFLYLGWNEKDWRGLTIGLVPALSVRLKELRGLNFREILGLNGFIKFDHFNIRKITFFNKSI